MKKIYFLLSLLTAVSSVSLGMQSPAFHPIHQHYVTPQQQAQLNAEYGNEDASPKVKEAVYKALRIMGLENLESIQVKKLNNNKILYGSIPLDGLYQFKTIWIREESPDWYFTCFHEAAHCYRFFKNLDTYCCLGEKEDRADMLAALALCVMGEDKVIRQTIDVWKNATQESMIQAIRQQSAFNEVEKIFIIELIKHDLEAIIETYTIEFNNVCLFRFPKSFDNGYPTCLTKVRELQIFMDEWDNLKQVNITPT